MPPEAADSPRKAAPGRKPCARRLLPRMRLAHHTPVLRLFRYDAVVTKARFDPKARLVLPWSIGHLAFRQIVPRDRPARLRYGPKRRPHQENANVTHGL